TTRPKRVTSPYSVMSRAKNEETSAQTANASISAGRVRLSTMFDRLFAVVARSPILACPPSQNPVLLTKGPRPPAFGPLVSFLEPAAPREPGPVLGFVADQRAERATCRSLSPRRCR